MQKLNDTEQLNGRGKKQVHNTFVLELRLPSVALPMRQHRLAARRLAQQHHHGSLGLLQDNQLQRQLLRLTRMGNVETPL